MTAVQPALDDDLTWIDHCAAPPGDRPPTPFDLRQHEMWDLRGQHANPAALWTAHNVPTGDLL